MNICLISHSSGKHAGLESLEEYLLRMGHTVCKVLNPIPSYSLKQTQVYFQGELKFSHERRSRNIFRLLVDLYYSLKYAYKVKSQIYIGASNFDTLAPLLLRKARLHSSTVIYHPRDFTAERGNLYLKLEQYVLKNSDYTISNTRRAESARLKLGLKKNKSLIVSNGVYIPNVSFPKKQISKKKFIYIGDVTKEHGLLSFLKDHHTVIQDITVIGQGDQWHETKKACEVLGIHANFFYRKPHDFVLSKLKEFNGFGLAPYDSKFSWTTYCSPLKVNGYIGSGVPVLISDAPEVSQYIEEKSLGVVYEGNDTDTDLLKKLHDFKTTDFNERARNFYQLHNYDAIYALLPLGSEKLEAVSKA